MMNFKEFWTKKTLIGLGLGQLLSFLITSTGFTSSELAKKGKMVLLHTSWIGRCRGQFSWNSPRKKLKLLSFKWDPHKAPGPNGNGACFY
ncbi:hypothetical protein CIPAW_01G097400 [Carya illinoinensis]|uniref:Uncharacterized protein n=1 Tax=Carya illinoinensis TaxID=32201 RepID=A0A8T1RJV1_CARIL|nr:hypothetical protein CIPAW_01G097400 [Carya illinoinensis]